MNLGLARERKDLLKSNLLIPHFFEEGYECVDRWLPVEAYDDDGVVTLNDNGTLKTFYSIDLDFKEEV